MMNNTVSRRLNLLSWVLIGFSTLLLAACGQGSEDGAENDGSADNGLPTMTVYKTPDCGCCSVWVDYVKEAGFQVEAHDVSHQELNEVKQEAGLPFSLGSCHTAFIGDYVVEGHIPAEDIKRLLEEQPDVLGIAVPGMPIGSPGMEVGDRQDPYEVLTFDEAGETSVFSRHHQ